MRREEKPYPEYEILFPLGGHPLLPSTTPIADSFIRSVERREKMNEGIPIQLEWNLNVLE